MLVIQNDKVAELGLKEIAVIMTLDSDFLQLNKNLQKTSRIIYFQLHPRDPKRIRQFLQDTLA